MGIFERIKALFREVPEEHPQIGIWVCLPAIIISIISLIISLSTLRG